MPTEQYERVRTKYRLNARFYHLVGPVLRRQRVRAVEMLGLRPGDGVVDVGSGTGLSFPLLEAKVGPGGRLVAVELSEDMMERARQLAAERGWTNITFIESAAQEAALPASLDAAFFFYTHDIMQSLAALENVLRALRPGATVVAAGGRAPREFPACLLSPMAYSIAVPFITDLENYSTPWTVLEGLMGELEVELIMGGMAYIARGRTRDQAAGAGME